MGQGIVCVVLVYRLLPGESIESRLLLDTGTFTAVWKR